MISAADSDQLASKDRELKQRTSLFVTFDFEIITLELVVDFDYQLEAMMKPSARPTFDDFVELERSCPARFSRRMKDL